VSRKWVATNPIAEIKRPKRQVGEIEFYSPEEAKKLLETALSQPKFQQLAGFYILAFFSGVRVEELMRAKWGMIDIKEKEIRLPSSVTKTIRPRNIEISDALFAWLKAIKIPKSPKAVIVSRRGFRGRRNRLHPAAGVSLKGNALRHTFATFFSVVYRDPGRLQLLLG
jgi:integrase